METALGIIIALLLAVIGWLLNHSSKCADFHERVAKLEEWKQAQERREAQR